MFWILTAAMTAMVAAAILRPFFRSSAPVAEPAAAYDLGVYRDQLREVDRDVARGVLTEIEAERLRTEIGRKILDADRAMVRQAVPQGRGSRPVIAAVLLVAALAASAAVYWRLGAPAMPDLPLGARIAAADERLRDLPTQADAEARAPERPKPQADPDYLRLIEQLRAAVAQRPDDARGLALLAEHEARLGNSAAARQAQERLIAIRGSEVQGLDHTRLAALMIEAAGGFVSAEARAQIEAALRIDPADGQARYLQGLMYAQNDRPDIAFGIWRDLLETGPAGAPWMGPIRQLIPDLAWLAGQPDYVPPEVPSASALPGPDADTMAAAGDMTPEERQQMIAGMVQNLETRLATEGGTPEEWARLITSLVRIGNEPHAREILAEARTRFGATPDASAVIEAAAAEVGLSAP
ncbi:c-type cytochrome biogenesis protein CcmI [Paracoccus niistensis]|uniref:C-type cytochrome biogenesis protein CcmI n=1 Tax=Paracoccus niistensis TaxID=632935 RepID=A0ABV6I5X8_9RHOB